MSILMIGGIGAGAFLIFNAVEYVVRRYSLSSEVVIRNSRTPAETLQDYKTIVDTLYESLWHANVMLSPGINLATKHFKKVYRID